jgi:hypothetical protein
MKIPPQGSFDKKKEPKIMYKKNAQNQKLNARILKSIFFAPQINFLTEKIKKLT